MANTLRESTESYRSGNASDSAGPRPLPALDFRPNTSTSVQTICQSSPAVPLPILEPMISRIGDAVDIALESHTTTNGATVSVTQGNMAGRKLFAVSIYPELTLELKMPPSRWLLFAYALANVDKLLKPGRAIGLWSDRPGRHVVDIVFCCPDLTVAISLGRCFQQKCIYSLAVGFEIQLDRHRPTNLFSFHSVGGEQ